MKVLSGSLSGASESRSEILYLSGLLSPSASVIFFQLFPQYILAIKVWPSPFLCAQHVLWWLSWLLTHWPAGTTKQETKSPFEIFSSCHLPQFVNASNTTKVSYNSMSTPPYCSNCLSERQPLTNQGKDTACAQAHELKMWSQDSVWLLCMHCYQHVSLCLL